MTGDDGAPDDRLRPGTAIGVGLTVLRRLGGGGPAEVYLVWSDRHLTTFACKLLRPALCDDAASRLALLRDGQALSTVAHPRIVRLYDVCRGARPYLLLAYLDGPSASALLREHGRFPIGKRPCSWRSTSRRRSSTSTGAATCTWT